ncbi:hypothetical protein [Brevibacillus choshinensis]|uniref:Peptidase n=1 Tax=Brevibacillus choshinensis TaxID=54911 RepID=A0ABX7FQJ4_BRECH|nr:hypothetical protein [Brevibacillus choshinensis]QRG67270.1 hypothetical protein JNE38_28150 [Brevibacillus choshinensis]
MSTVGMIRKPAFCVLTGALTVVSLYTSPIAASHQAKAANIAVGMQASAVVPVPVQVSKGVQQLVRLIPELSNRYVVFGGDVDGPGVSGVIVTFAPSAAEKEAARDQAIFDPTTGNLLKLDLEPKAAQKPIALTDQQARARASAFVAGLPAAGSVYQARSVTRESAQTTVRLVRTVNNVALDDSYDAFVTFDGTGRVVAFRTFDGRLYEKITPTALPSPQRIISAQQAVLRYKESHPLELIYLLPSDYSLTDPVQAKLTYVVKDGVIKQTHTGSALDAFNGKRLSANEKQSVQTVSVNGTGEKWIAQSEQQAQDIVRKLLRVEPQKLPFATFTEAYDNGQERRFFIWGHFNEGTIDQDKPYSLGQFPAGVKMDERAHLLVETDAMTGQLLRLVKSDGVISRLKTDKQRDWKSAEAVLKRLLPTGTTSLRVQDVGDATLTLYTADPMINGIPVYQEGQTAEQGMYTIRVDSSTGKIEEISIQRPVELIAPARTKALVEQGAVDRLLKAYPLELTYIHQKNPQTGATTWKLGYDLSFRQTKVHCFCGVEEKVDLTVRMDAVTGNVMVKE